MANDAKKSWFSFQAAVGQDEPELLIYDYIGYFGVTAKDFDAELKALGVVPRLTVRINSPGGETPTAASIYNMLARYKQRNKTHITVVIDGIAASSGSWLAMIGDEVVMPENSLMMIHDPSGGAYGTADEIRRMAEALDKVKQGMVTAYASKSGKPREEVEAIMAAETWYDAQEAVDNGFADRVEGSVLMAADFEGFDPKKFKNPPAALVEAMRAAAQPSATLQEVPMTTKTAAPANETPEQMVARIRAEVTAELTAVQTQQQLAAPVAAETPAQMEARIRGEFDAKAQAQVSIRTLCAKLGQADKAEGFIAEGKSLADVVAALSAAPTPVQQRQQQTTANLNAHRPVDNGQQQGQALEAVELNPTAIMAKWNRRKAFGA